MLSRAQNELLTQTGPGTPLGELYRRYWIPALLSEEIPTPDGAPARVRLLGEKLVAFRDSQDRIGLIDEHCPHRDTSLFFGRNEKCGLTCIYHGWKIAVDGRVVETPAEPAGSDFKNKLHHRSYTGIEDFINHDACATETMGPIYDRTKEHLGVSDQAVIALRKYLLNAVQKFQQGGAPPHLVKDPAQNNFPHACSIAEVVPATVEWRQHYPHLTRRGHGAAR